MAADPLQLDSLNEQNLQVMQTYAVRAQAAKAANSEEFDGWLERISSLSGYSDDELTQLHGELIARGFLKFEISGRSVGLRYQISPAGRQALVRAEAETAADAEAIEADSANEFPVSDAA